jgi:hypothetical protein
MIGAACSRRRDRALQRRRSAADETPSPGDDLLAKLKRWHLAEDAGDRHRPHPRSPACLAQRVHVELEQSDSLDAFTHQLRQLRVSSWVYADIICPAERYGV